MAWKPILKALLAAILPVVYTLLKNTFPNFPLAQSDFVALVLWLFAFVVGGWQANNFFKAIGFKE